MSEILFLAHRAPWPPDRGDRIRSWRIAEALRTVAPVHVAALADCEADAAIAREHMAANYASLAFRIRRTSRPVALLRSILRGTPASVEAFRDAALARDIDAILASRPISAIVAFSGQMAAYLPPRESFAGRIVMDFVDVDSAKFEQFGAAAPTLSPMGMINRREGRLLARWEEIHARAADAATFVTEAEAALFRERSGLGEERVLAIGNGIDTGFFAADAAFDRSAAPPSDPAAPLAVFTGQMDYRPNIEAVSEFARIILPRWRESEPGARFAIVGRAPTGEVKALAGLPGVIVTGEVPDVRPWLAAADAVVAPLALARGVQNKLLEALAMARPVVASPGAAEGIDADHGIHLIVADGAGPTAAALVSLGSDSRRAAAMGAAARERMIGLYGWDARLAPIKGLVT
jgi:sugar transferase (PEP-CTERM/EpsH1 system associated)